MQPWPTILIACLSAGCFTAVVDKGSEGGDSGAGGDSATPIDCGHADASQPDGSLGVGCSGASPSFAHDVTPIIYSCGSEMCHGGIGQNGSWPRDALVNVHAARDNCSSAGFLVVPGKVEQSYFMNKLTGVGMCPDTQRMPMGSQLQPKDIQTVADWICEGAQDN